MEQSAAYRMQNPALITVLARALNAGEQDVESIARRIELAIGRRRLPGIAERYLEVFAGKTRPRRRDVERFLVRDLGVARLRTVKGKPVLKAAPVRHWLTEPQQMLPVEAARDWDVPAISSIGELCAWLRLTPGEMEWFSDPRLLLHKAGPSSLHHYCYSIVPKRNGDFRLIEAPKQRLKLLQRQILREIVEKVPAHPAAHGFIRGRNIQTFTAAHTGKRVILRTDVQDFFPSISASRVQAMFRTAGYPDSVSTALTGICTNAAPPSIWKPHQAALGVDKAFALRSLYARRHLPQGAPTSPALANCCAYRLDCRLHGYAEAAGAAYTRYADDLAFSGDEVFERHVERFRDGVGAILLEGGFMPHFRKTRVMRRGVRQRLAGLIVNEHTNIAREEYDNLKAILTNCVRHGAEGQNRGGHADFRAHLLGRVGFVGSVNSVRGANLRALLERIQW